MEQVHDAVTGSSEREVDGHKCVVDMNVASVIGTVASSRESTSGEHVEDNILESVRFLYGWRCNKCTMERFGEDAGKDNLLSCVNSDDGLTRPCDFGLVDFHLLVAAGTGESATVETLLRNSCEANVVKQKIFAEVVQGARETDEAMSAVSPWKFNLGECKITTQEIAAVQEDSEEGETPGEEESSNSEEIEASKNESCFLAVTHDHRSMVTPIVDEVKSPLAQKHCESGSCLDDCTVLPGGRCENLTGSCGKQLLSHMGVSDDDLVEFGTTLKDEERKDTPGAEKVCTEPQNSCVLVDSYENDHGVVMVTQQLQVCEEKMKVSMAVQCGPKCISVGCQVDLYDSDASDDVTSSSADDNESGIDGDTECDVGEDSSSVSVTRGSEDTCGMEGWMQTKRETGGTLSVMIDNLDRDDDSETDSSDCDDDENDPKQHSISNNKDEGCESSSSSEDEDDGKEGYDKGEPAVCVSQETSESKSDDSNSSAD